MRIQQAQSPRRWRASFSFSSIGLLWCRDLADHDPRAPRSDFLGPYLSEMALRVNIYNTELAAVGKLVVALGAAGK
ncbi:hypothetical protein BGLA2_1080080 [Burkholderia gladioli]|nr:hypothetical protein BGLA2_1080080 [Burkholderia gladioli]